MMSDFLGLYYRSEKHQSNAGGDERDPQSDPFVSRIQLRHGEAHARKEKNAPDDLHNSDFHNVMRWV
jgi:hypothetical protein